MKNLILLISVMVLSACASMPTVKSVLGTYERIEGDHWTPIVLLENGILEVYENGKKEEKDGKWKLTKEGELHVSGPSGNIAVCRINKNRSITLIAEINKDFREDLPINFHVTYKKIK